MNRSSVVVRSSAVILLTIGALGCGSSSNPSLTTVGATANPLVAQYSIREVHAGLSAWVEFGTDTNYGRQTSEQTVSSGSTLTILVAGMKAQTTYHMRAHVDWPGGSWVDQDQTFTTGALPTTVTVPTITVAPPTAGLQPAPGVELLNLVPQVSTGLTAAVTDLAGNVIWYCQGGAVPAKQMDNGDYLLNLGSDLREVDLACNIIRDVTIDQVNQSLQANGYDFTVPPQLGLPGGSPFSHDVLVLPNGHWIAICQIQQSYTDLTGYPGTTNVAGDAVIDIDPNGNVVWAWNSFDHLDVNRHPYFGLPDWTHSNALNYTADGNLLVSMRHQSWILKIDYHDGSGSGNILWKLGPDGDFTLVGGDPTQWFYSQHYPNVLSDDGSQMTLAVFDNGNYRPDSNGVPCGTTPTAGTCYTRAATFQVDESTFTATLLWADLPGFYSFWGGSVQTFSDGDVEFDMSAPTGGTSSQIMEVTQAASPQTVWQMNIDGENAYRGYRIPSLYPGVTWTK